VRQGGSHVQVVKTRGPSTRAILLVMKRPAWIALGMTATALAFASPPSASASARPSKAPIEVTAGTPAPPAAASPEVAAGAPTAPAVAAPETVSGSRCTPGARTLAPSGERVYPETGNGGYTSVHTEVNLRYSAATNRFLSGNHVALTASATQCLSSLTLDLEPTALGAGHPELSVASVTVDGKPAAFSFVQPTYPGDPLGPEDPDPRAHEASQNVPVGGPQDNPLPPACSPELRSEGAPPDSRDGAQCPANKLLITPRRPIAASATFLVDVAYTGRPGVHKDANGEAEGWFRAPGGGLVATEPIGARAWMPLNDYPTAKPTYSFHETVETGKVALANGVLQGVTRNPPDSDFPAGSATWNWESGAPVASYLVQSSIGNYSLSSRVGAEGVTYYQAQDEGIPPAKRAHNAAILDQQEEATTFESLFNGPYPFASDGAVVGSPSVAFEEEMQTMISFNEGVVELPILWHENMHQWWGDNVSESSYETTFFKEGLAEWMESYVFPARALKGGEFEQALIATFDAAYANGGGYWTIAPSRPFAYTLFSSSATYERPAAAYEALRRILGPHGFDAVLQKVQHDFGAANISEPQLEAAFAEALPNQSPGCRARLGRFFGEWFDTAYAPGGGAQRPQITGPGLDGTNFYGAVAGCPRQG
jgi:Peptidase family M1 domain